MESKSTNITCDQTLVETDKVMKVSEFLGKSRIKKYFYVLSKISDEKKLEIIFPLITQKSSCAHDIAYILDCSIATASHHLRMLRGADILDRQEKGKITYCPIKDDDLKEVLAQFDR